MITETGSSARTRLRLLPAAALVAFAIAPAIGRAATEQDLETRLNALAAQVAELQSELETLNVQRAAQAAAAEPDASMPVAAAPVKPPKLEWFGYGELNYQRPRDDAARATADLGRFVVGTSYRFDAKTRFASELEIEHAVSSADDPGEVELEQAYIERSTERFFTRYGLFLMPVGLLNENHEPTRYNGVFRNFVETAIIPTTWREGGVELEGTTASGLRWDAGVSTGFNLAKWDAASTEGRESPLGSIHQELALASAGDLSVFGALNYTGWPGLKLGGSVFYGNSSQGQPGFRDNQVTLSEAHVRYAPGNWQLSALFARGHIANTREPNIARLGNPTPVPAEFFGRYVEGAYRATLPNSQVLVAFARYEIFNTASSYATLGAGLTPAPLRDEKALTTGISLEIAHGVVLKADYATFDRDSANDRLALGLGYEF